MVRNTIKDLAEEDKLGSVVIESCDIRWNTTMEALKKQPFVESLVTSEMKVASDEAIKYARPCVLGDQRINATGASLGNALRQTFVDITTPFSGGWGNLSKELKTAADVALPTGDGYLSPRSILDPSLLLAAPISFAKYPFSFLVRNPISTSIAFTIIGFLTYLDANDTSSVSFMDASLQEQVGSIAFTLGFTFLEFLIFGRLLVQVLLAERNEILAANILAQCKIYSNESTKGVKDEAVSSFLSGISQLFFGNEGQKKSVTSSNMKEIIYVPDCLENGELRNNDNRNEKVVVAVLGMAHCNGITKLLKEGLVE